MRKNHRRYDPKHFIHIWYINNVESGIERGGMDDKNIETPPYKQKQR